MDYVGLAEKLLRSPWRVVAEPELTVLELGPDSVGMQETQLAHLALSTKFGQER
jgi:hypothetical protein